VRGGTQREEKGKRDGNTEFTEIGTQRSQRRETQEPGTRLRRAWGNLEPEEVKECKSVRVQVCPEEVVMGEAQAGRHSD